jgi:hypothetical protein
MRSVCWLGVGVVFHDFYDHWAKEECGGHYWEGHLWVSAAADAAGGGKEHRQHVCHKQGVPVQEEGTGEAHSAVHERRIMAAVSVSFLFLVQMELA